MEMRRFFFCAGAAIRRCTLGVPGIFYGLQVFPGRLHSAFQAELSRIQFNCLYQTCLRCVFELCESYILIFTSMKKHMRAAEMYFRRKEYRKRRENRGSRADDFKNTAQPRFSQYNGLYAPGDSWLEWGNIHPVQGEEREMRCILSEKAWNRKAQKGTYSERHLHSSGRCVTIQ